MSDDKSQSKEINIPGDGHTFIGNANEVNINGPANVYLAGEAVKVKWFLLVKSQLA